MDKQDEMKNNLDIDIYPYLMMKITLLLTLIKISNSSNDKDNELQKHLISNLEEVRRLMSIVPYWDVKNMLLRITPSKSVLSQTNSPILIQVGSELSFLNTELYLLEDKQAQEYLNSNYKPLSIVDRIKQAYNDLHSLIDLSVNENIILEEYLLSHHYLTSDERVQIIGNLNSRWNQLMNRQLILVGIVREGYDFQLDITRSEHIKIIEQI